jgi:glutamate racemase
MYAIEMIDDFLAFFSEFTYSLPMNSKPPKIGIFDSGLGGLTVAREIRKAFPWLDLICLGDTARFPYGIRSPETLRRYLAEGCAFFEKENVSTVILACNTLSSLLPVSISGCTLHGVIESGARAAIQKSKNGKIGLIATQATITSKAYARAIQGLRPDAQVFSKPTPLLVPLIEEGWLEGEVPERIVHHYLESLLENDIDTLILGCTHYPLLRGVIEKELGQRAISIIDNGSALTAQLSETFEPEEGRGSLSVFVTDAPERFQEIASRFMGEPLESIKKIDLTCLV